MAQLVSFLSSGKPVYFEGGDFGYSNSSSELWNYLGTSYDGDGQPSSTGNVQTLAGEPGSFADGMTLSYPYQQGPDNYVDEFGAAGGAVVLRSQDNIGRVVGYDALTYRTIVSATVYGASTGDDRDELMAAFVDYLMLGTGIGQAGEHAAARVASVTPSMGRVGGAVRFQTSGAARDLSVLDVAGRKAAGWHLPAGSATTTWNIGTGIAPGAYFLQVRSQGTARTCPFTVVR